MSLFYSGAAVADERQRALDLFEKAEVHYKKGELEKAVELLTEARRLHAAPVLLYNLARAHEGLGHLQQALDAYERFLEEEPNAPDRGAIEKRITTLRQQIEEHERLMPGPKIIIVPEREEPMSVWPWVPTGVGVLSLGTGVALGALSSGQRGNAERDPVHESAIASFEHAEDLAVGANIAFVAGAALTVVGVVWLVLESVDQPSQAPDQDR